MKALELWDTNFRKLQEQENKLMATSLALSLHNKIEYESDDASLQWDIVNKFVTDLTNEVKKLNNEVKS
jgi:hypothetical protein